MRSAARSSRWIAAVRLRHGGLNLRSELGTFGETVERCALQGCNELGDRGVVERRRETRSAAIR